MKPHKTLPLLALTLLTQLAPSSARSQDIASVIASGITRVIRAFDLKIQRLQNQTIWLQEGQKVLENALSELSLNDIHDWVAAQKDLYASYFEELWTVKNAVATYSRIDHILQRQQQIIARYAQIRSTMSGRSFFSAGEMDILENACAAIIKQTTANIDQLTRIVESFNLQTTDEQRTRMIDQVADDTDKCYFDLNSIGDQQTLLALQRGMDAGEIDFIKKIYGL